MSWFSIFGGDVIFGGLRLCDTTLDWQFSCNIFSSSSGPGYCNTFPDSTCQIAPSEVFSSWQCATNTTTPLDFFNGCPGHEKYFVDYEFRQLYPTALTADRGVNVSVVATFNCEEVVMEHNGTGLFVTVQDNTSKAGCPGFVASNSTSTSGLPSSTSSIPFSNSTTSASILTSTFLTTKTYTVTSCPPSVKSCPVGAVTTEVMTSYTTFCPGTATPMVTPRTSCLGCTSSPTSNGAAIYSSQPIKSSSTIIGAVTSEVMTSGTITPTATLGTSCPGCTSSPKPNGTAIYSSQPIKSSSTIATSSPPAVQVNSGSTVSIPWVFVWYSAALQLFSIQSVLGSLDINTDQPIIHARNTPDLMKRIPVADFADIQSFGTTLSATMESNLPTIPGTSLSLLQSRIVLVTNSICQAGKQNRNLYGPNWTTTPELKLLSHMLADCATSMDQMDQDLLSFYTQAELDAGPQGVLFLKFAGIMYCNRLIAPLVNDPASLNGICGLVA